jgi:hypothetical protein
MIYFVDILIILLLLILILSKNPKSKKSIDHSNYMEWITDGRVDHCSKFSVGITSLEDLVKLAVDMNSRVIHDAKLGKYFVLTENMTYIHDPSLINTIDNKQQLGKILIERGMLLPEQLETGLYYQKRIGCKLGESLIALGFIDETILYSTLAAQQKISYYELDVKKDLIDTSWLNKLSINKAKALQALPMGNRVDGKLVVACGETVKPGIAVALKEALGTEIYIVAARPLKIQQILDKIEKEERQKSGYAQLRREHKLEAYERLSDKEWEGFKNEYYSGTLNTYLFIKATGMVDQIQMDKAPNHEIIISWLLARGLINGQFVNLLKTLEKLVSNQDKMSRQQKSIPQMLDLLKEAYYLTEETKNWIDTENKQTKVPISLLLDANHLVSPDTVEYADRILDTLKTLLNKTNIF